MNASQWQVIFCSGSLGPVPGELLVMDEPQRGQWPPDGARMMEPGSIVFQEPFVLHDLEPQWPLLVVSVSRKTKSWRMVVFHRDRLWWLPISRAGSGELEPSGSV